MRNKVGFTLLELLVTLLIVSMALLGIVGIIANSLKYNQSAKYGSDAVTLASDIIDRMRANRTTAEDVSLPYNLAMASSTPDCSLGSTVSACDLNAWRMALADALPTGTGSVELIAATRTLRVVVQWDDSRPERGSSLQQVSIETRL